MSSFLSAATLLATLPALIAAQSNATAAATTILDPISSELAAASASEASFFSSEAQAESSEALAESSSLAFASSTAQFDPSATGLSILQLITPTTQASQVPFTILNSLSADAFSFYTAYTDADKFDFNSQIAMALSSQPTAVQVSLEGPVERLATLYFIQAEQSILDDPSSYLSRLHESASPFPNSFSSSLASQVSAILTGYESLASKEVLSKSPSYGPVTPGISINVGAAPTAAGSAGAGGNGGGGTAGGPTATSKGGAAPAVGTAGPMLVFNAAVGAAGVVGLALL